MTSQLPSASAASAALMGRRGLLALGAGALAAVPAAAHASPDGPPADEPPADLPVFTYAGEITEGLDHDPTGEFIFPSLLHAGRHLSDPLGEWYLYFAPHENPGGICLMHADSPEGPWTEHPDNPLIENSWGDHYSVPHVSSPDVIWDDAEQELLCFFHGPNGATRFATSADGVHFEYGDVAVSTDMIGPDSTEASYARVFEDPDPHSVHACAMLFMENTTADHRRIRVARSVDGRSWEVDPEPLITPGEGDEGNVSGADLWWWRGRPLIINHASSGVVSARAVDRALRTVGPPTVLHRASGEGEDVGRIAAPQIITHRGRMYMVYEKGDRLGATIAYAVADVAG